MWAFAIYNVNNNELFCSRDRFGIKPFYYILEDNKFYFSSEIKTLQELPIFNKEVNVEHLHRFLYLGLVVYKNETFFKQIQVLEPAFILIFSNNNIKKHNYWNLKSKTNNITYEKAKQQLHSLLKNSVTIHLRSDVKLGACLSGGIDSSILSSIMSKYNCLEYEAYNIYYEGNYNADERKWVKDLIDKYPNIKPNYFSPSDSEIKDTFKKIINIQDGPIASSAIISQYFLFDNAKKNNIKVMIDGQGADEIFAGYFNFYPHFFSYLLKNGRVMKYFKEINIFSLNNKLSFSKMLLLHLKAVKNIIIPYEYSKKRELNKNDLFKKKIKNYFSFSNYNKLNWSDVIFNENIFLLVLPNLLHFEDRNSMTCTIESRVPFLDHRLVEFAFNLPFDFKP